MNNTTHSLSFLLLFSIFSCQKIDFSELKYKRSDPTYYYTATEVSTLIGGGNQSMFKYLAGMDFRANHLWVTDLEQNLVFKIDTFGNIVREIGKPDSVGCSEINAISDANVLFDRPVDIAVDLSGNNAYVLEQSSQLLRLIGPQYTNIFAGLCYGEPRPPNPTPMMCRDSVFSSPLNIAIDGQNFYVADNGNIKLVTKGTNGNCLSVQPWSVISTSTYVKLIDFCSAGSRQGVIVYTNDNTFFRIDDKGDTSQIVIAPATDIGLLSDPSAIATDNKGNIFIADKNNHKIFVLYKNGQLRLLAGSEEAYTQAVTTGLLAKFSKPSGLALDENSGTLYVSDTGNKAIRKIKFQ